MKVTITVLTVIGDILSLAGVIGTANFSQSGWWAATGFGSLLVFIALLMALREAWWTRAWLWLVIIWFTSAWIGPLLWGMFGPGMIAPAAKQKLRAIRDSGLPPGAVGINAPVWTPELAKFYLQREGFTIQDDPLHRALRQLHWLIP